MKLTKKPLVVVGIDPGTTLGYAILDLGGNLLKIGSERGGSLNTLIEESTNHGIPVIAATDKAKCPELVHQFSAKTGARVVAPAADLLTKEKKILAGNERTGNSHELDAVSAARFALKKHSRMLAKVDSALAGTADEKLSDDAKRMLLQGQAAGITEAVRILKDKHKNPAAAEQRNKEEEFVPSRDDYLKLKESLRKLNMEYRKLKQSQEALFKELERMEQENSSEEEEKTAPTKRKLNWLMKLKTKRIRELDRRLVAERERSARLKMMITELGPKLLAKRLDNLTYDEFLKKDKALKINAGDILLVEDVNSHSKKTLEELRGKVGIILCNSRITSDLRNNKDMIFLDASKLKLWILDEFALVEKAELESLKRNSSKLVEMFEKYKESRKREY